MSEETNKPPQQDNNEKKLNNSSDSYFVKFIGDFKEKLTLPKVIGYLVVLIVGYFLDRDIVIPIMLLIAFTSFHFYQSFFYQKKVGYLFLLFALICFGSSIYRYFTFSPEENSSSTEFILQQKFAMEVDDKVNDMMVILIKNEEVVPVVNIDIGIGFLTSGKHLRVRVKVPDVGGFIFPKQEGVWGSIRQGTTNPKDGFVQTFDFNTISNFDTLFIPIRVFPFTELPFTTIRDFQGMYFSTYLPKEIIPGIKECLLVVNKWIIVKYEASDANWRTQIIDWEEFSEKKEFYRHLVKIDLHTSKLQKFREWKPKF